MKTALTELIDDLTGLGETHDEVTDTAVREEMFLAIHHAFIKPKADYKLPDEYGMFSAEGNKEVKSVLQKFLAHPEVVSATRDLTSAEEKLEAFQDPDVQGSNGDTIDEFFGYSETVLDI